MKKLNLNPRMDDPDGFYEELIELHNHLTFEQSQEANARLILLLANHIGELQILTEAISIVREGIKSEVSIPVQNQ